MAHRLGVAQPSPAGFAIYSSELGVPFRRHECLMADTFPSGDRPWRLCAPVTLTVKFGESSRVDTIAPRADFAICGRLDILSELSPYSQTKSRPPGPSPTQPLRAYTDLSAPGEHPTHPSRRSSSETASAAQPQSAS
jgi:hypothetical protein